MRLVQGRSGFQGLEGFGKAALHVVSICQHISLYISAVYVSIHSGSLLQGKATGTGP